jgi:UDPglucose 6-dehydrogenase
MSIGVIGLGFVGSAVENGFQGYFTRSFDKKPELSKHSLEEVLKQDFVFICVPTPMKSAEVGKCDLSIIENCIDEINEIGSHSIFIIKSTVPIGFTLRVQKEYPRLKFVHSPEFLTAINAQNDFENPDRNVVGHTGSLATAEKVVSLYRSRFPSAPCFLMSSDESEMTKYIANCFLATKVSFFNEMYDLVCKMGGSWESVSAAIISDARIGKSHFKVPGPDGSRGFGGTCFPKDINSLIYQMHDLSLPTDMLMSAWTTNLRVREDHDWLSEPSAVSNRDESKS